MARIKAKLETEQACDQRLTALREEMANVEAQKKELKNKDVIQIGTLMRNRFGKHLPEGKTEQQGFIEHLWMLHQQSLSAPRHAPPVDQPAGNENVGVSQ